jgi:hypothetical protein
LLPTAQARIADQAVRRRSKQDARRSATVPLGTMFANEAELATFCHANPQSQRYKWCLYV